MAWRSSDVIGSRRDELATTQMDNRNLDCTLREPGGVRDRAHTGTDGAPVGSCGLGVKVQINEIRRRLLVVADQIAHQHIDDVIVNGNGLFEARITM